MKQSVIIFALYFVKAFDTIKEFTHVFVKFLEKLKPNEYISTMTKSKRTGKIFIDYLRNQRTATAIGDYSTAPGLMPQ